MTTPDHPTAATMYCLGCRYCLDGLADFRCPEFGRGFDPSEELTYARSDKKMCCGSDGRIALSSALTGFLLLVLCLFLGLNATFFKLGIAAELVAVLFSLVAFIDGDSGSRRLAVRAMIVVMSVAGAMVGLWFALLELLKGYRPFGL